MEQWKTGDVITAERLNEMNNVMVVEYTQSQTDFTYSCNRTLEEIVDYINNDGIIVAKLILDNYSVYFLLKEFQTSEYGTTIKFYNENFIVTDVITIRVDIITHQKLSDGIEQISFNQNMIYAVKSQA